MSIAGEYENIPSWVAYWPHCCVFGTDTCDRLRWSAMVLKALKSQQTAPFHRIVWPGLIINLGHMLRCCTPVILHSKGAAMVQNVWCGLIAHAATVYSCDRSFNCPVMPYGSYYGVCHLFIVQFFNSLPHFAGHNVLCDLLPTLECLVSDFQIV